MSSLPPLFVVSVGYLIDEVGKCLFAFVPKSSKRCRDANAASHFEGKCSRKGKIKECPGVKPDFESYCMFHLF